MGGQFEFQKFLDDVIICFLPELLCIAPNFLPTTLLFSMSANLFLLALHLCYRYFFLKLSSPPDLDDVRRSFSITTEYFRASTQREMQYNIPCIQRHLNPA